tara:strand:- start:1126 stop:2292 length:1167 start_codon:yes stop_codon:yes gene_type:complete
MRSTGNVGIGTNDPDAILHIHSSAPGIRLSDSDNAGDNNPNPSAHAFAYFDANAANAIIHADKGDDVSNSRVAFAVDNDEKMRVTHEGDVGINSESPIARLDVFKPYNGLGAGNPAARIYGIDSGVAETGIRFVEKGSNLHTSSTAYLMRGISNGETKFVFGSNGKVGIGTDLGSEPPADRILTICSEEDSHNYLSIQSGSAKFSGIVFGHQTGNTTDNYRSFIRHSNVDDSLNFHTNSDSTPKFSITTTGAFAIGGVSNYGTTGKVLTSNGNAAPSWEDAGGSDKFTVESTTGTYTLVAADSGKLKTVTGAVTIPDNVFEQGDTITVYNNSGSTINLTQGSGATVRLAGSSITGTRQLAQRGLATIICVVDGGGSNDEFLLLGAGVI